MKCPNCGKENEEGTNFCVYCGTKLSKPQGIRCPKCGRIAEPGTLFCVYCGTKLPQNGDVPENASAENAAAENTAAENAAAEDAAAGAAAEENSAAASEEKAADTSSSAAPQDDREKKINAQPDQGQSFQGQAQQQNSWQRTQQNAYQSGPQNAAGGNGQNQYHQYGGYGTQNGKRKQGKGFHISGKLIAVIAAAAAAVIVLVIVLNTVMHTIDLNKYISVEYSGADTNGTAEVTFDEQAFKKDNKDKIKINKKKLKKYLSSDDILSDLIYGTITASDATEYLEEACLDGELSETEDLSNGDKITFEWDCDDELAKEVFGVRLKYSDKEFTVSDLPEMQKIDLFEGVSVSFTGTDGDGEADLTVDNDYESKFNIFYELDNSYDLHEGDTVTVTVESYDDLDTVLAEEGYVADETEKEFTVSGLSTYLTTASDIPDDVLESMKSQTEDLITSSLSNDSEITVKSRDYIGNYFLTTKDTDSYYERNIVAIAYQVVITVPVGQDGTTEDVTYFTCAAFPDLMKTGDQVTVDLTEGSLTYDSFTYENDGHWFYLDGYQTKDLMNSAVSDANVAEYNVENNVQ